MVSYTVPQVCAYTFAHGLPTATPGAQGTPPPTGWSLLWMIGDHLVASYDARLMRLAASSRRRSLFQSWLPCGSIVYDSASANGWPCRSSPAANSPCFLTWS